MSATGSSLLLRRSSTVAAARLRRPLARPLAACIPAKLLARSNVGGRASVAWERNSASAAEGHGVGVAPRGQRGALDSQRAEDEAAREGGLSKRWGWSETAHRFYYPLKALGVFSAKNTNALTSSRMLQTCLNNAERSEWYSNGKISNEFLPKLLWLGTNVWLFSRRLLREGERGKRVQELLFDELWRETKRQMRSIEVSEMMLKKYLGEAQQHTFVTLVQYDHAFTLESPEERLEVLTGALWRGVYMSNDRIKEPHVRVMAKYIESELAGMYKADAEDFFAVCLEFGPPPPQLKTNKQPKAGGKMSMKGASPCAEGSLEDLGASSSDRAIVGQGGLERVQHGDFGEDGNGRWRASLAESGKVYYWHTGTREVTWDKPPESESFVPSTMPKTEAAEAA